MRNIPFDLEDRIMDCWNVTSDIKVVYEEHLDSPKPMDEDMYNKIMNYRRETIEEENFKIASEENAKFLYGNLR